MKANIITVKSDLAIKVAALMAFFVDKSKKYRFECTKW